MTTYTTIADSDIDPESPGTTTLFTRLRDNPIAITEGAAGAPSIANAALAGYPFSILAGDVTDAGFVKIDTWAGAAVASKAFTWDETTYGNILIVLDDIAPVNDGDALLLTLGYANGTAYFANHGWSNLAITGTTLGGGTSASISLTPATNVGNATNEGVSGTVMVTGTGSIVGPAAVESLVGISDTTGAAKGYKVWGYPSSAPAPGNTTDTARFTWNSTGNFKAQGSITLYGLLL